MCLCAGACCRTSGRCSPHQTRSHSSRFHRHRRLRRRCTGSSCLPTHRPGRPLSHSTAAKSPGLAKVRPWWRCTGNEYPSPHRIARIRWLMSRPKAGRNRIRNRCSRGCPPRWLSGRSTGNRTARPPARGCVQRFPLCTARAVSCRSHTNDRADIAALDFARRAHFRCSTFRSSAPRG